MSFRGQTKSLGAYVWRARNSLADCGKRVNTQKLDENETILEQIALLKKTANLPFAAMNAPPIPVAFRDQFMA